MKIFKLTLACAMALFAGSSFANVTPNVTDASGNPVKDGSGACVVSSGIVHPDCAGVRAANSAIAQASVSLKIFMFGTPKRFG